MTARIPPLPDEETAFFWSATAQKRLDILRCDDCGTWIHTPRPACWNCASTALSPRTVSGRGTIHSFTVTHRAVPGFEPPFAVVMVELDEQPGLRMISNLVDTPIDDIAIGAPVEVEFREEGDVVLPLFRIRR